MKPDGLSQDAEGGYKSVLRACRSPLTQIAATAGPDGGIVCEKVADGVPLSLAALAEPFSVGLHAVSRAGSLLGKRVLVSGCGPIGALAIAAARVHGAAEVVATDIVDAPLAVAPSPAKASPPPHEGFPLERAISP